MKSWNAVIDFRGRLTRRWMWLGLLLYPVSVFLGGGVMVVLHKIPMDKNFRSVIEFALFIFGVLFIELLRMSIYVRRLHDMDLGGWLYIFVVFWKIGLAIMKSGKWQYATPHGAQYVASLFLAMGGILELVLFFSSGTKGPNAYGPAPQQEMLHQKTRN